MVEFATIYRLGTAKADDCNAPGRPTSYSQLAIRFMSMDGYLHTRSERQITTSHFIRGNDATY